MKKLFLILPLLALCLTAQVQLNNARLSNFQVAATGGGGGSFTYTSVSYNGTDNYLSRGADLTGVTDSGNFTLSVWVKCVDFSSTHVILANTSFGFPGLDFYFDSVGATRLRAWDNAGDNNLGDPGFPAFTSTSWVHWLISVNCGGTSYVYTNDVLYASGTLFSAGSIDLTQGDFFIGSFGAPNGFFNGLMSEFWFCTTTAIDISNTTNRRLFISAGKKPVDLGADGSTPLGGTKPAIYLHNAAPNFQSNLGSGGGFTLHGTLTDGGSDIP